MKRAATRIVLAASVFAVGCGSPEATRSRGGGPGADPGNRGADVLMHEGSRQYYETPVLIPDEPMPLDPAHQARELSLPSGRSRQSSSTDGEPSPGAGRGQ
jgi:hypothetical protein